MLALSWCLEVGPNILLVPLLGILWVELVSFFAVCVGSSVVNPVDTERDSSSAVLLGPSLPGANVIANCSFLGNQASVLAGVCSCFSVLVLSVFHL